MKTHIQKLLKQRKFLIESNRSNLPNPDAVRRKIETFQQSLDCIVNDKSLAVWVEANMDDLVMICPLRQRPEFVVKCHEFVGKNKEI